MFFEYMDLSIYHNIIDDLVGKIQPCDPLEKEHLDDALEWIRSGVELCRFKSPATPPKHLVSYFVLLDIQNEKILLVDHKKSALWLPPGGHVEPGEHPLNAAHRELDEELNVQLPMLYSDPVFISVTETIGDTAGHIDVSLWYVFEADSTATYKYDKGEFNGIQWYSLSKLPLNCTDPHLDRFCQKLITSMKCYSH